MSRLLTLRRVIVFAALFALCLWLYGRSRPPVEQKVDPEVQKPNQVAVMPGDSIVDSQSPPPGEGADRLTIGSLAPPLDIQFWIQQGGGKFPQVKQFEAGKVYVVEFWATWCGPCIRSMPHLVELQKQYGDGQVQIISVSDETPEEVNEFLQRPAGEQDGQSVTFQELTSAYCLTTDPDGSTNQAYPMAARLNGIPCAFIVGKEGRVEWIGHPMEMDEPLAQVVDGRWDREAFAATYNEEREFEELLEKVAGQLQGTDGQQPSVASVDQVFTMLDDFLARAKSGKMAGRARFAKFDLMIQLRPEDPALLSIAKEIFAEMADRPIELHTLAWGLYEISKAGQLKNPALVQEALAATQAALPKVTEAQRGTVLDTVAHLQAYVGDLEGALASAREVAKAPDASPEAQAYVTQLEQEIEKSKKPASETAKE
jgi:thiol-disulfide isomerase/thioredoxin